MRNWVKSEHKKLCCRHNKIKHSLLKPPNFKSSVLNLEASSQSDLFWNRVAVKIRRQRTSALWSCTKGLTSSYPSSHRARCSPNSCEFKADRWASSKNRAKPLLLSESSNRAATSPYSWLHLFSIRNSLILKSTETLLMNNKDSNSVLRSSRVKDAQMTSEVGALKEDSSNSINQANIPVKLKRRRCHSPKWRQNSLAIDVQAAIKR